VGARVYVRFPPKSDIHSERQALRKSLSRDPARDHPLLNFAGVKDKRGSGFPIGTRQTSMGPPGGRACCWFFYGSARARTQYERLRSGTFLHHKVPCGKPAPFRPMSRAVLAT
jgi:hypothetical protein